MPFFPAVCKNKRKGMVGMAELVELVNLPTNKNIQNSGLGTIISAQIGCLGGFWKIQIIPIFLLDRSMHNHVLDMLFWDTVWK